MSNYTHCRGCGKALSDDADNPERDDGLCVVPLATEALDCTEQFGRWWKAAHPDEKRAFEEANRGEDAWKGPLWSVKVDEWLATR